MEIGVLVTTLVLLSLFAAILASVALACFWRSALGCFCNSVARLWGCCRRRDMSVAPVQSPRVAAAAAPIMRYGCV